MANLVSVFPSANAPTTITVKGRIYTLAVGATPILVPDFDAFVLLANGWLSSTSAGNTGAGATTQRPLVNPMLGAGPVPVGFEFYDSTVGGNIIWNGKNWINHATGANA
jgi:hypothetical protein